MALNYGKGTDLYYNFNILLKHILHIIYSNILRKYIKLYINE